MNIYISGLFFIITNYSTVGYGDVIPKSIEEMLVTMLI